MTDAVYEIIQSLPITNFGSINLITAASDVNDEKLNNLKTEILKKNSDSRAIRLDDFRHITSLGSRLKHNIFIFLDKIENFHELNGKVNNTIFDYRGKYIFILYNGFIDEIQEIFNEMWKKFIYNVYVIYEDKDEIKLSTFLPFENNSKCGDTSSKIINKFTNGKYQNSEIFVKKFDNFYGCPLKVTGFLDPGCVMRRNSEFYGHCIDFMKEIAKLLNFQPQFDFILEPDAWGQVYANGSSRGLTKKLIDRETDIAFGDLYLKAGRTKYFDATMGHKFAQMVFIIPPGRQFTPLEKLLQPFHWIVWIVLVMTFAIGVIVILVLNRKSRVVRNFVYGSNVKHPILNMISAILGLQQSTLPQRNFARFLLMMLLILCLVFRSAYQGALYKFLQSDGRHPEVESIKQLIDEKYTIYIYSASKDLVQAGMPELLINAKYYDVNDSFLTRHMDGSEKLAGLENLRNVISANRRDRGKYVHRYCKEIFMSVDNVWYVPKNSYLTHPLNRHIKLFLAGGFIQYWYNSYHDSIVYKDEFKLKEFDLNQLAGCFYLLLIGYLVGIIIFVGEIVIDRMKVKRKYRIYLHRN